MTIKSELPGWLAQALQALQAGDVESWMAIYAPDAVHEFPFAPEGGVRRLSGREEIAAYLRQLPERISFGLFSDIRARQADDEIVIEATGHHRSVPDGLPRTLGYVWFIVRRDDRVTLFRDYMSPVAPSAS